MPAGVEEGLTCGKICSMLAVAGEEAKVKICCLLAVLGQGTRC